MVEIAQDLVHKGKTVIEPLLGEGIYPEDKDIPESRNGLYTVPQTEIVIEGRLPEEITFPVVAKEFGSRLGRGVKKINSHKELRDFSDRVGGDFLIQEFFEITYDTR